MENERTDVQQFWSLPSGPAVIYLAYLLNAAPDWARLRRLEQVSHGTKVTEEACGRGLGTEILFRTAGAEIRLTIRCSELLKVGRTPAKRLLPYLLHCMAAQRTEDGRIVPGELRVPLGDLVSLGFYGTIRSARVAAEHAMQLLRGILLSGRVFRPREEAQDEPQPLFSGYSIQNGTMIVRMNEALNWAFVFQSYTLLPCCCAQLPARAAALLLYLSQLARQNLRRIAEDSVFTVRLASVKIHLGLPEEEGSRSPLQEVLQPILDAADEVNRAAAGLLRLTTDTRPDAKAKDALRLGRLQVRLEGNFAEYFCQLQRRNQRTARRGRTCTTVRPP